MALKIWQETVHIPTYGVGERDRNPMFLEKRVYQGSSGRVYPWPVVDRIEHEKHDKAYQMVFLENEYIQVQVMPELGGKIYRAIDKTNGYDFVYWNQVIKPALVGLAGPWVSGGIEFNWPQHHRPNTYGPVSFTLENTDPHKKTVWLHETDRMYGTRVTTGISIREGVSAIEISCGLYNPTSEPQTFLWWANPAVAVHEETQSIFPPDVHAVMDHGKRDVSRFPIATGTYYKMDYSSGVDISRYKNLPVPTSYMAYHSDFDFVGGYDYKKGAGILHIADHHISPGKKQWTWGNADFGQAWDRNLTDAAGPYIELMTGVFTDNQPDFTWLAPHAGKNFTQWFMPYKAVGEVTCANNDIVAGLSVADGIATVRVYAPKALEGAVVRLTQAPNHEAKAVEPGVGRSLSDPSTAPAKVLLEESARISPVAVFEKRVATDAKAWELTLTVTAGNAATLSYTPAKPQTLKLPEPAKAIGAPETLRNTEALYLAGLHLEQYRHATYEPEPYYLEGLKRDPGDIRLNNAYGRLLLRRGEYGKAQALFERARETATRHSPNPYDGEVFYNLGMALEGQGKDNEAFDVYYKAIWSDAWRSQGYLKLAQIAARQGRHKEALSFAKEAMWANYKNFDARAAVTVIARLLGRVEEARAVAEETLRFDPMNLMAVSELVQLAADDATGRNGAPHQTVDRLRQLLRGDAHQAMLLAQGYRDLGCHAEGVSVLRAHLASQGEPYAMVLYFLADSLQAMGAPEAERAWKDAARADSAYCFPNMPAEYQVLKRALGHNPEDAMAHYYLGCFLYDKRRHEDARTAWEESIRLRDDFPTAHRNLALYHANKQGDFTSARRELEQAFRLNPEDARVFYELCELYRKTGVPLEAQRRHLEAHPSLVALRDDLTLLYVEILNCLGEHAAALDLLMNRTFRPWEGGEGKVPSQHIEARLGLARQLLGAGDPEAAIRHLEQARVYHHNFGEGKLPGAQENHIFYTLGLAWLRRDPAQARGWFEQAAVGLSEPTGAMYYNDQPPHMIYYQGLALLALDREAEARSRFHRLIAYGEKHLFEPQVMDYFAVSLPDFLVFETDLDVKNQVHCLYMMGLGHMGLGHMGLGHAGLAETARGHLAQAEEAFEKALTLAPGHQGVLGHLAMLRELMNRHNGNA
jgi:tetratricopeptide (TPR) repeat protein